MKWSREACFNEAKKYKSRGEFSKYAKGAYNSACKNGWINDYTWFPPSQSAKKWNRETCYSEAKKYNSITDFRRFSGRAYQVSLINGWFTDYSWLKRCHKTKGYWTREKCYDEAKSFISREEFANGSKSAYEVARQNGWLDEYTWFKKSRLSVPKGFWNRESCYLEAKRYKSKQEFHDGSIGAYQSAKRNGWLDDYTWFEHNRIHDKDDYLVYRYFEKESNSTYVGLTHNISRRHEEHCRGQLRHGERVYDIVHRFFESINKTIPEPQILIAGLTAKLAQHFEGFYIEKYKKEGINVINLAKAGSLGGLGMWTRERCFEEAINYSSRTSFCKGNAGAYSSAWKNGWLDDYVWFKTPDNKWNESSCFSEAKKYNTRTEFAKGNGSAYYAAVQNGWINDYTWLITPPRKSKWDFDLCEQEAKKYKSRWDFQKGSKGAYLYALKMGWLDNYIWLELQQKGQKNIKWNQETCYNEALKFRSRTEFSKKSGGAYNVARKKGWLDDYTWFKTK